MNNCPYCGIELRQYEDEFPYEFKRRKTCRSPVCLKEQKMRNLKGRGKTLDKRYRSGMTVGEWQVQRLICSQW